MIPQLSVLVDALEIINSVTENGAPRRFFKKYPKTTYNKAIILHPICESSHLTYSVTLL